MMLIHLVKRDFLIVKKYVLLMFVVCVIIPPFMVWRVPEYAGPMSFVLSAIFAIFMLLQYVSLKEYQYPRASTMLCTTPYPRKLLVLSKYVFCLVNYAVCCVIFWIETFIFAELGGIHFEMPILMFLVLAVFLGVYLPVQYKLGYEKTKFAFVVIIMASPFVFPQLLKMEDGINLDFLNALPPALLYGGIILIGLMILIASACVSVEFYKKTDLE